MPQCQPYLRTQRLINAKLIDQYQFLVNLYMICLCSWLCDGSTNDAYIYVSLKPNEKLHILCALSWPSGGHCVCLMTAIFVYRLSNIMFASHCGIYMKILHGFFSKNYESASILLTIIIIVGFHKWRPSWILPIMQYLN